MIQDVLRYTARYVLAFYIILILVAGWIGLLERLLP